jgi:hypothetical protein
MCKPRREPEDRNTIHCVQARNPRMLGQSEHMLQDLGHHRESEREPDQLLIAPSDEGGKKRQDRKQANYLTKGTMRIEALLVVKLCRAVYPERASTGQKDLDDTRDSDQRNEDAPNLIRTALKTRHRVTVQNPMHEIKRCLGVSDLLSRSRGRPSPPAGSRAQNGCCV